MSVIWKFFDGIQREETSISHVRSEFPCQSNKALFQWQFDLSNVCALSQKKKEYHQCNHYFSIFLQEANTVIYF